VFVGCPVLRNTNLPCWLGESKGELYYLGPQGDLTAQFYPPEFNHQMVVEGTVTDQRICGGLVLKPVKVSILPEVDVTCNVMLPAMGYEDPPHQRGPGPSGVRGVASGPLYPRTTPVVYTAPFKTQTFDALFDAGSVRPWGPAQSAILAAARYANTAKAKTIHVTGYRAAFKLTAGGEFTEPADLAEQRAKFVEQALHTLDLPPDTRISAEWHQAAVHAQGMDADVAARKVSIVVTP
jgi:outer membrane protein OmpA-like peptidoglycan-associated protein